MTDSLKVVVMTKEGPERESIKDALESKGFIVSFSDAIDTTFDILEDQRPSIFLMFADTLEDSQMVVFMQRLDVNSTSYLHFKVMVVPELTAPMYALASDAGIDKLIASDASEEQVAAEIKDLYENADLTVTIREQLAHIHSKGYEQIGVDEAISQLHDKFPDEVQVKLEYGHMLLRQNEVEEAELVAAAILNKAPHNVRAMGLLSRVSFKRGDHEQGLKYMLESNALSPDNPTRLCELGELFFEKGNYENAKDYYERAHEILPDDKEALKGLGGSLIQLDDAQRSIDIFRSTMSEDEIASFFNNAGVSFINKKDFPSGIRFYEIAIKALQTDHYKHQILFNKALALKKKGELESALSEMEKVIELKPDFEKAKLQSEAIRRLLSQKKAS
jgi:tetratricopeptide (TPR) repeat protein